MHGRVAEISVCACSCQPSGCFLAPLRSSERLVLTTLSIGYTGSPCLLIDLALIAVIVNSSISSLSSLSPTWLPQPARVLRGDRALVHARKEPGRAR